MNVINHTAHIEESRLLVRASAAAGERLLEEGHPVDLALKLSSAVAQALRYDIKVREIHHRGTGKTFDDNELSTGTVYAGIKHLLTGDIPERYGLELGHVVNFNTATRTTSFESERRLQDAHDDSVTQLQARLPGLSATSDGLPSKSYRTARFDDKDDLMLAAAKTPIADLTYDGIRVETHERTSFGVYALEGALEADEVRALLQDAEKRLYENEFTFAELPSAPQIVVFPATSTLVGLKRSIGLRR